MAAKWDTAVIHADVKLMKLLMNPPSRRSTRLLNTVCSADCDSDVITYADIQRGVWNAARFGKEQVLSFLLNGKHGMDAMRADTHGMSTLYIAVTHSHEKCVKLLLDMTLELPAMEKTR